MLIIKALFIGIVQGLTAFLPVSSTGHGMLLYTLLDMKTTSPVAFMAAAHLGSLVAILFFNSVFGNCARLCACFFYEKRTFAYSGGNPSYTGPCAKKRY